VLDDVGFFNLGAFGSEIRTHALDAQALMPGEPALWHLDDTRSALGFA